MKTAFRLRIALLAAVLSGIVLTAFAVTTWWLIRNSKIEQLDREVRNQAERESQRTRTPADWQRVEAAMATETGLADSHNLILLVQDRKGVIVYRSSAWPAALDARQFHWPALVAPPPRPPGNPAAETPLPPPASRAFSLSQAGRHWRIGLASAGDARVAVAIDIASINVEMKAIRAAFLVALPVCLILMGLGAWMVSHRALLPLRKLTAVARRVTAEGLDQRIPSEGEDREHQELIEVFNGMLERLERGFKQAQRFSADAAHELKTPLAILQGQIERAIQNADDGSVAQAELSSILDEVRRLSSISRKLLLLSQADAGRLRLHLEPFNLSKALLDLIEDTAMLAPHLLVSAEIEPDLMVSADSALLPQVLHNLISNAIKYNVPHGWIRLQAHLRADRVEILVSNSSEGIPQADRVLLFERFYRARSIRNGAVEGVGLGLSVSREIARAHGGDLTLQPESEQMVEFSLCLPR